MDRNITYKVIAKFDFYLNDKILNFIYVPMIGYDAVNLYRFLYNDYQNDLVMGCTRKEIHKIPEIMQWETSFYNENKNILEAVGLIDTYLDEKKGNHLVIYLNQAPSWNEFKANNKLLSLLKKNVDTLNYDRIRYLFEGNNILDTYTNISCSFENIFNDQGLDNIRTFDFNCLYDTVFKMYQKMIIISDASKAVIESYYKVNELTFKEVLNIVIQSIYRDEKGIYVDNKLLRINFEKLTSPISAMSCNQMIEINRNHKIFLQDISDETFDYVIQDYKIINAEQYLSCISKAPITQLNKNLIEVLRKQYHLPDFIINVLIDYSIYKNAGRIEPNYIQSIAMTINRLNITNIEQLLEHLRKSNVISLRNA